jgi:chemotaxis-related protein WspD
VNGDQSCDRLEQHVHCRNCEVYAAAAQQNLQRPSATTTKEWAAHFRQAAATTSSRTLLPGVPHRPRMAVAADPHVRLGGADRQAAPPAAPRSRGLSGIVNVGGTLYPACRWPTCWASTTARAKRQPTATPSRLLLTQWEDQAYALPVADLHGMLRYASSQMQAPAATINKGLSRFLTGVISHHDMRIGVLDETLIGYQLARTLR